MTLDILQKEMIAAMKAKDKARKDVIASLVAAVKKAGIDAGCRDNIPEDMVNNVLLKEQKSVREMIDTCPAERDDLLMEYTYRRIVINEFAPKLISDEDEIAALILKICSDALLCDTDTYPLTFNKSDKGKIMKVVMPGLKGKVDMKIANKVLGEIFK